MESSQPKGSSVPTFLVIAVLIIIAFVVVYYSYNFLFAKIGSDKPMVLLDKSIDGSSQYTGAVPSVQLPYEGGDYTISFWLFVSSNTFINGQYRKHIFYIGGTNFSTVAIGIDAIKNSLIVRTHSGTVPVMGSSTRTGGSSVESDMSYGDDSDMNYVNGGGQTFYGGSFYTRCANGSKCDPVTNLCADGKTACSIVCPDGYLCNTYTNKCRNGTPCAKGSGSGSKPGGSGSTGSTGSTGSSGSRQGFRNKEGFQAVSIPDCAQTTTLFADDMASLFDAPVVSPSADCQPSPQCDIAEFDLQRWNLVTVVLSGKVTDVYVDGKLARSCVAPSYYKVDTMNVTPNILQHKTFDGKIANLNLYSVALNPAQIYQIYSSGPQL